jgi:hypothetical protein
MVRRKQLAQASAAKMYRHFAVVTVAATAMMAILVDGENRAALAHDAPAPQVHASGPKYGRVRLASHVDPATRGSFGPDSDLSDSSDDDGSGVFGSEAVSGEWDKRVSAAPNPWTRFGLSEAEWNALGTADRARLAQAERTRNETVNRGDRAREIANLQKSSADRAGEATAAD